MRLSIMDIEIELTFQSLIHQQYSNKTPFGTLKIYKNTNNKIWKTIFKKFKKKNKLNQSFQRLVYEIKKHKV